MLDILFLDDSFNRHNYFCNKEHDPSLRWEAHECTSPIMKVRHVYTADQAICSLMVNKASK